MNKLKDLLTIKNHKLYYTMCVVNIVLVVSYYNFIVSELIKEIIYFGVLINTGFIVGYIISHFVYYKEDVK